jgi:hypothetical protein
MELWMKDPAEMQPHELMQIAADFFESQGIGYRVVGSLASMAYGEPRFTNDVDMVVELTRDKIAALSLHFRPLSITFQNKRYERPSTSDFSLTLSTRPRA